MTNPFFHRVLFAFDLAHWIKRLCLQPEYLHATLDTLRTDLLVVPARLVRRAERNVLPLPQDYRHRDLLKCIFHRARRVQFPAKKLNLQMTWDQNPCVLQETRSIHAPFTHF